MTFQQFLNAFSDVVEAYGSNKFPHIVLERIHSKVDDFDAVRMRELCHLIIDNCEHAPRTAKVGELANLVRARHQTGLFDKFEPQASDCRLCEDLRTVRAISTDGTHETLMLCECTAKQPDPADWKFPAWSREWGRFYRAEKCPVEWFKPTVVLDTKGIMKLENTVEHKRQYWISKVRIAEQFWISARKEAQE